VIQAEAMFSNGPLPVAARFPRDVMLGQAPVERFSPLIQLKLELFGE
jgi:hypothetical protein